MVKEVKNLLGLGLKEAKELVDGAPKAIKEGLNANEAKEIKEKLEALIKENKVEGISRIVDYTDRKTPAWQVRERSLMNTLIMKRLFQGLPLIAALFLAGCSSNAQSADAAATGCTSIGTRPRPRRLARAALALSASTRPLTFLPAASSAS